MDLCWISSLALEFQAARQAKAQTLVAFNGPHFEGVGGESLQIVVPE